MEQRQGPIQPARKFVRLHYDEKHQGLSDQTKLFPPTRGYNHRPTCCTAVCMLGYDTLSFVSTRALYHPAFLGRLHFTL